MQTEYVYGGGKINGLHTRAQHSKTGVLGSVLGVFKRQMCKIGILRVINFAEDQRK